MKKIIAFLSIFLGAVTVHAVGPFVGYVQISSGTGGPIQPGGFNTSTGTVGSLTASTVTTNGFIKSTSGGFIFPDGSTQTSAANAFVLSTGTQMNGGSPNSVVYLDASSKTAVSSNLTFDGTTLTAFINSLIPAVAGTDLTVKTQSSAADVYAGGITVAPGTNNNHVTTPSTLTLYPMQIVGGGTIAGSSITIVAGGVNSPVTAIGGNVVVQAGNGRDAAAGTIQLLSGSATHTSGGSGQITIQTGTGISSTGTIVMAPGGVTVLTVSTLTVTGNGSGLTNLTAANVSAGTLGSSVIASSIAIQTVGIPQHSATGTPSASTFLRGDNSWSTPAGGGVTIGNAVTGGGANRIIFEDNGQNVNVDSALAYSTTTGVTASTVTFSSATMTSASAATLLWTGGTSGRVPYETTGGQFTDKSGFTFDGTTLFNTVASGVMEDNAGFRCDGGGSAGAVAFRMQAGNNGMFGASNSQINWAVAGTENMRLTSTGLKIGSAANAGQVLDVAGSAVFSGGIIGNANSTLPTAGNVGEINSTGTVVFVNVAATGNFGNVVSKSYAAGNYSATGCVTLSANGATLTDYEVAISSFTGNTTTDHVEADNWVESAALPISTAKETVCVNGFSVNLAAATTMYLKVMSAYSVATPQAIGKLKLLRVD